MGDPVHRRYLAFSDRNPELSTDDGPYDIAIARASGAQVELDHRGGGFAR